MSVPLYWRDTYRFRAEGVNVVRVAEREEGDLKLKPGEPVPSHYVVLGETIFHPQGGGQPADQGVIVTESTRFTVSDVRKDAGSGEIRHFGVFEGAVLQEGEQVTIEIDEARRRMNARLHSAGHLLDSAVHQLGLDVSPGKGYHFPDGAYVEYTGSIPAEDRERVKQDIEQVVNELIAGASDVDVKEVQYNDLPDVLGEAPPSYISPDQPCRVVSMAGSACPCGGTHVPNTSDIGNMRVTKLSVKKKRVRVCYQVE